MPTPARLLDVVRAEIRLRHYSYRTQKAYVHWILRFIRFHGRKHPKSMGGDEVRTFLSHLATDLQVSPATQAQALSALLFLYKRVLHIDLPWIDDVVRARRPKRLPTVLDKAEARRVIAHLRGDCWLIAGLLYGSGLRLLEALRLRVKDLDLYHHRIMVCDGKGTKDRVTILPDALLEPLCRQVEDVRTLSATPSPPNSSNRVATSALSRSSWATRASRRLRSTLTSSTAAASPRAARSTELAQNQ